MSSNSLSYCDPFSHHHPDIFDAPPRPHLRHQHHHHHQLHQLHRESAYELDAIEDAEFIAEADLIDYYYLDDEGEFEDRFYRAFRAMPKPRPVFKPALRSVKVRLPEQAIEALGVRDDDVLIMPAGLIRMKVHLRCAMGKDTLQASVAGDMRVRDVLKQVVPADYAGEVWVWFRLRGEWQKLDGGLKVSQLSGMNRRQADEKPEVEVMIEVAGGGGHGVGGMMNMRSYEWERFWGLRG
ncbi:hypothetical protein IQ07DRAFT_409364 [Pyrenochaeta sp. DS3sAY3a]|nr:hypothetical protein IQ07DRAFT_409364 [Pyrenochaeta sp. DS3sAY3a]